MNKMNKAEVVAGDFVVRAASRVALTRVCPVAFLRDVPTPIAVLRKRIAGDDGGGGGGGGVGRGGGGGGGGHGRRVLD